MGSGLGLGIIGFVLRLVGFCVGFGGFSGWASSGWGGLTVSTEVSGVFTTAFMVRF